MKKTLIFLLAVCMLLSCGCNNVYRYTSTEFYSMTTIVNVISDSGSDFADTKSFAEDFENRVSRTVKDSEIYKLNEKGYGELSDETLYILEKALEICEKTDGAFNPCLGTVTDLWDITSGKNYVPGDESIEQALKYCDASAVSIDKSKVTLPEGMKIDLGGVAKGYALEKMVEIESKKSENPNVCVSIGGNVGVVGSSENNRRKGVEGWNVGITNPFDKQSLMATLLLKDSYISVSGAYERNFEKDGILYHHIFDSKTGKPSQSGLASAAVICRDGLVGDALSTALYVMGKEKAAEFYKSGVYDFEMILVTDGGDVLITKGLAEIITLNKDAKNINQNMIII